MHGFSKIIMTKIIKLVYEKGILKLLEKVNLKEGEIVKIRIERSLMGII